MHKSMVNSIPGISKLESAITFGGYMRSIRESQHISIRALAKEVNKTPTYISDIEHGNNKPPNKELLDAILIALHLKDHSDITENFYDLAAIERGDLPADIKEYVMKNQQVIGVIRLVKNSQDGDIFWNTVAKQYYGGGNNNG